MNEFGIESHGVKQPKLFNSKYPIIAAPMNQVSEITLAVAVHRAGGFPSISGYCYDSDDEIIKVLEDFVSITRSSNIILAVDEKSLLNEKLISTLKKLNISHVLRHYNENYDFTEQHRKNWRKILEVSLKKLTCQFIEMKSDFSVISDFSKIYFVKGSDGAGRPGSATTKELFDFHKRQTPAAALVPVGGIGTSEQVKYYLDNNANAVAIGTLFAVSEESKISKEVKNKMISAKEKDIERLDDTLKQNALIFNRLNTNDNLNNTCSLKQGIKSAQKGHVFLSKAIDKVDSIRTVDYIIQNLVSKFE